MQKKETMSPCHGEKIKSIMHIRTSWTGTQMVYWLKINPHSVTVFNDQG